MSASRQAPDLADVLVRFFGGVAEVYPLTPEQHQAARDIRRCRTAEMGGHLQYCCECGEQWPAYNSCRNRHCSKCQGAAQLAWIESRLKRLLDTHYFHVVFTVPRQLRALALTNPQPVYDLLMWAAGETLLVLGRDERRLGGELGVTAVLHTWSRDLQLHPHVHCIVTGGGLDESGRWQKARGRYLFPGRVMAALFRAKVLAGLESMRRKHRLRWTGQAAELADSVAWAHFKDGLYRTNWVVHAKRPFAGPAQVITYLGRYTHRVGISNSRLLAVEGSRVRFRTRGHKQTSLSGQEFVRRFLLHVLPKGFRKIRHYGLMAPVHVKTRLARAQALLAHKPAPVPDRTLYPDPAHERPQVPLWQPRCPACGSTLLGRTYLPSPDPAADRPDARGPPTGMQLGDCHA